MYIYMYIYITIPKNYKDNIISHYEKERVDLVFAKADFCDVQQIYTLITNLML